MTDYIVWFAFTKAAARTGKIYLGQLNQDGSITWAKKEKAGGQRKKCKLIVPEGAVLTARNVVWNDVAFESWGGWFFVQNGTATAVDKSHAHQIAAHPALDTDITTTLPSVPTAERALPDWLHIYQTMASIKYQRLWIFGLNI